MVHQQFAALDLLEDAVRRLRARPPRRHDGRPGVGLELGPVEPGELPQVGLVEEAFDVVDVVGPDAEALDEALAQGA